MKADVRVLKLTRQDGDDVDGPAYVELGGTIIDLRPTTCISRRLIDDIASSLTDGGIALLHGDRYVGRRRDRIGSMHTLFYLFTHADEFEWMHRWLAANDKEFHSFSELDSEQLKTN